MTGVPQRTARTARGGDRDWLARINPERVVAMAAGVVAVAWAIVLAVAYWNPLGLRDRTHIWLELFNDRPVEWLQWVLLAFTIGAAGFLAGRLYDSPHGRAARFFALLSAAAALMLVEEAGDVRHVISDYMAQWFGGHILGLPYRVVSDVPYFALLAALPLYALLRYGPAVWRARRMRPFLVGGYGLYCLAALSSGTRHLRGWYSRAGEVLHNTLLGGRLPVPAAMSEERMHFLLIDGPVEESVELLAAACLLATVAAFARDVADGRVPPDG